MQKSHTQKAKSDAVIPETWEDAADLLADALELTMPEPVENKPRRKKTVPDGTNSPDVVHIETNSISPSLAPEAKAPTSPDFGKVRIMKRDPRSSSNMPSKPVIPTQPVKSYEERVVAYNEARMRIFGCLDDDESQNSGISSSADETAGSGVPR